MDKGEKMVIADPNFLVKPPKKERTEAQKQATAKAFEALRVKREAMNKIVSEVNPELVEKKPKKSYYKPAQPAQQKVEVPVEAKEKMEQTPAHPPAPAPSEDVYDKLLNNLMSRIESKTASTKEVKKEKKKKVVIVEEEDSSSSSEEEVVIKKKKEVKTKEKAPEQPAQSAFKSTGSHVLDKLLFSKF